MDVYLAERMQYLAAQSWQIAILTAAVAAATFALRRRSAHIRYLLWLIVLAKCLVPPVHVVPLRVLPPMQFGGMSSAYSQPQYTREPSGYATSTSPDVPAPLQSGSASSPHVIPVREYCLSPYGWSGVLWIAGVTVYLMMNLLRALRGHDWLRRTRKPFPEKERAEAADRLRDYGVRRLPEIWIMAGVSQPFVWGLLRGSIYVPLGFHTIENPDRRRDILAHELSHVVRFDAAVNALQVIAQSLFWFHPVVWWVNYRIRQEREKCCDEMAIARLGIAPKDYGTAIIETLSRARGSAIPVPSLAIASPLKHLQERIRTMLQPGKQFYKRPSLIVAFLVILVILLVVPTMLVLTTRPMHVVSGTVRIAATEPDVWGSEPRPFDREAYAVMMQTEAHLLSSSTFTLAKIVDDLAPRGLTFFSPLQVPAPKAGTLQSPETILRQAIAEGVIRIAPIPNSELLEVTMLSGNPEEAKTVVNSFLRNYVGQYSVDSVVSESQNIAQLEAYRNESQMRIRQERAELRALIQQLGPSDVNSVQSANPDIEEQRSRIKMDEEFYEKVSRRLREMEMGRNRRPRVQIAALAEVRGVVDHRGRWALVILGATVLVGVILLIMRHVTRSWFRTDDRIALA